MRESWSKLKLGEVMTLQRGFDLPSRLRVKGNVPIISSAGVSDCHNKVGVNGPGVVTGRYGTIGEVFYTESDYWPLNTTLFVSDFKNNAPLFCSYLLKTIDLKEFSGKSGVPGINRNDVHQVEVSIPNPKEQTTVANALSDVDALLTELEHLIDKKQAIKTATMQQLLTGKTRLPLFANHTEVAVEGKSKGTKPSELGEIPEGWEVGKLNGVCFSFKTGKLDANAMKKDGEYRFYTCAREHYYIDNYAFDTEALLVSGNGANVGYVHYFKGKFNAYQRTYVLSKFNADVKYLKIYLEEKLAERIRVEVNSGNMPYITMDTLTDMLIALPPKDEQTAIATILSDMDNEIQILEQRLTKTRQIKQGMMQQLLTGRTRLPY